MARIRKVSIGDLAEQVGVSTATVSRVMNNRYGINDGTRQRVLNAAREAGFRPRVATRLTTIGIVMDQVPEAGFTGLGLVEDLTVRVAAAVARHQFAVEIFTSGNLNVLSRRFLDGVLAIAWEAPTLAAIRQLKNVPVVIFNRPEVTECSRVLTDGAAAGRLAARHLMNHGHTRLAFLGDKLDLETVQRLDGFQRCVVEAGLEFSEASVGMMRYLPAYSTLKRLLRDGYTGMFLSTERLTAEVPYLCAEALRVLVPQDLSLVGLEVAAAMRFYRPPMTLVTHPVAKMADAGVNMLESMIASSDFTPRTEILEPELVIRDSVSRPRVLDASAGAVKEEPS
jgi:LacI family transcriptional regulator